MDLGGIPQTLSLRPKGHVAGTKAPPRTGPSITCSRRISHAKSAGTDLVALHSVLRFTGVTICLQCAFMKELHYQLISCLRKHVVATTGPSHLRLETISGRMWTCPVPRNLRLSLPYPAKTLPGEERNQLRRDMRVRRCFESPSRA